jgi:3'-phosphoadenosine 5'-phosphosulfate sulfotransferase (PAPS reductase)/FAD synthetase
MLTLLDETRALLAEVLLNRRYGRAAVVSSFGAESAVMLHLVAGIAEATPVIFLDTGKLFDATLRHRDTLIERLGLTDVRSIRPDAAVLAQDDPDGALWRRDPDACCGQRKVKPLDAALAHGSPGASAFMAAAGPGCRSSNGQRAGGPRSTRWPAGRPATSPPMCVKTNCRATRWKPRATDPSAA